METRSVVNPASSAPRTLEAGNGANPAAAPSPSQRPSVDLTALTQRDDFLLELGEALGGQASVNPVDSVDAALGQLRSTKRGQILVIDARSTSDVRSDVQRAAQQAPHAVVVVFTEEDAEKQTASAVKGTSVFAVLTVPMGKAKTTAVLDAAVADAVSRNAAARGGDKAGPTGSLTLDGLRPAASQAESHLENTPGEPEEGSRKWGLWAGLGAAVLLLGAGAAWYFAHGRTAPARGAKGEVAGTIGGQASSASPAAAALPQPAVDTSIVAGRLDDLLEKARRAMRERRFTAPTGNNALVFYRSALAVDPTSGEAKDGLRRVADVCVSRFDDAMSGGHYDEAALALATLKLAAPADPHLGPFQLQLSSAEMAQALSQNNADRGAALLRQAGQSGTVPAAQLAAWRAQLARLQQADKVASLAALVRDRIRADELTTPAGDSAQDYLGQLRAAAPSAASTEQAADALIAAFFSKAQQNALAGDTADESRWLATARASGASSAQVAQFQRQLASAQMQAAHIKADRLISLIDERMGSGSLTAPAGDSAADYLRQLEASHPSGSARSAARADGTALAARLMERARSEMGSDETAEANADLAAARRWGASAAAVAAVRHVDSSTAVQAKPAAAPAPDLQALAAQLKRTRYVSPEYPGRALDDRVSGSVIVQYVVDEKGYTRDVKVIQSSPPGVFDRAATDAIRRWRYRPAKYDGHPVAVPVRTRIRFELPN